MLKQSLLLGGLMCLAGCAPLAAQFPINVPIRSSGFFELSATDDGKSLFFTSVQILRHESEGRLQETRLYRFGSDGITLFAERGKLAPKNGFTSGDGVVAPQVSADGRSVAFTLK